VANTVIKATQVVQMARLLLQREIVLPRLVWSDFTKQQFQYAYNDTVTMSVPAVMDARSRTLRSTDGLVADEFAETSVDVKLDTHVYKLLNLTDENLTLDIRDFGTQVLQPQIRAVAEGLEAVIVAALQAADPRAEDVVFTQGTSDPYKVLLAARKALNDANVPMNDRVFLCGSSVELALLESDRISKAGDSPATATDALVDATVNRVAGFRIVTSNALAEDEAYAFHRTAIAFGAFAPSIPQGASSGAQTSSEGIGMRYIRDYNPTNSTGPVDRSLVDAFAGAKSVEQDDPDVSGTDPVNYRLVKIDFTEGS
jgi:hypothetical protein